MPYSIDMHGMNVSKAATPFPIDRLIERGLEAMPRHAYGFPVKAPKAIPPV